MDDIKAEDVIRSKLKKESIFLRWILISQMGHVNVLNFNFEEKGTKHRGMQQAWNPSHIL